MTLDAILYANRQYARTFALASRPATPARALAILTCMDVRLEPLAAVGLETGDAHVVRNAGGRARDGLRSLALSCELFGTARILVVHHSECGMQSVANEAMRARLAERGADPGEAFDFLGFADLAQSVRDDVALLRASPLIPPDVAIDGLVYDVRSGLLTPVA